MSQGDGNTCLTPTTHQGIVTSTEGCSQSSGNCCFFAPFRLRAVAADDNRAQQPASSFAPCNYNSVLHLNDDGPTSIERGNTTLFFFNTRNWTAEAQASTSTRYFTCTIV